MFFKKKSQTESGGNSGGPIAGMIAGLGNPGPQYEGTRHNLGAIVVLGLLDYLHNDKNLPRPQELSIGKKYNCLLWKASLPAGKGDWLLALPQTYMNLSGQAIAPLLRWHKLEPEQLLVAHDELDLAPGRLQLKKGGGIAGHKGLASIADNLGSRDFDRLRLGIGRPQGQEQVVNWVLTRFYGEQIEQIRDMLPKAVEACLLYASEGIERATNKVNTRPKKAKENKNEQDAPTKGAEH